MSLQEDFDEKMMGYETERRSYENLWVDSLIRRGIKAAHPDDGWVDREENKVVFCYPQFRMQVNVGDLIALGWPDKYRIVRVTGLRRLITALDNSDKWFEYSFEDAPE